MSFKIPTTQKAAVLHEVGGDYRIETSWPVTQPSELKPGECLVKLEYSGVCHSDLHIKDGDWGFNPRVPLIGGHEGVGVVVAIGEHTQNPAVKIGDRVGLKWLAGVCEVCEMCRSGHEYSCLNTERKLAHGNQVQGTFQQYAVSFVNYVTKIPDGLDGAPAAPILCAGVTVYSAVKKSGARLGQWVAITGAGGGLGHLGVQYAVAQGFRVVAIDTGEEKKKLALSLGAEKWVDFKESKNVVTDVQEATGGLGPQAAIITSNDTRAFVQAAFYLKNTGTLVAVGVPAGPAKLEIPIMLVIAKSLKVVGSMIGEVNCFLWNRIDADEALALSALGKVQCKHEVRNLDDLTTAFKDMKEGKIRGRVVLKI